MNNDSYHHNNLKEELINAGIEIINESGLDNLSLRNAAKRCNVSHAAPYKHFKNKDELLNAIQQHIIDDFSIHLNESLNNCTENNDILCILGKSYVTYFVEHPCYYKFIASQPSFHMKITNTSLICDDFQPFTIFKNTARKVLGKDISEKDFSAVLMSMWALVEGLSSILISNNVDFEGDYAQFIDGVLRSYIPK